MDMAYSYMRFSSPKQSDGDSIRRQVAATADWCRRNGTVLDEQTTFQDLGKSAYRGAHRKNPARNALAAFLKLVEEGKIARGSYLVIENLDRLTREHIRPALALLLNLIESGVRVVQLKPAEQVFDDDVEPMQLMMAIMELSRGNSESRMKSERMGAVWGEKKAEARRSGKLITARLPGWLESRGGKLVPIPDKLRTVKTIFRLCIDGFGLSSIVKHLTEAKVDPFGRGAHWSKAYIHKLLAGRAVLGEHQPLCGLEPDGAPIAGYYPTVISQDTWDVVQAALARRKGKAGPIGEKVANLFGGLLFEAGTGDALRISWQTRGSGKNRQKRRVLVTGRSMEGAAPSVSFPHEIFEEAVLRLLKEVDPADVLGAEPIGESTSLAASLNRIDVSITALVDEMETNGESAILFKRLREKEAERQELAKRLTAARQRERTPRSAAFSAAKTLLDVAGDEAHRLRLRELLRTIVEEIVILIVPAPITSTSGTTSLLPRRRTPRLSDSLSSGRVLP